MIQSKQDPLISVLEEALQYDQFIERGSVSDFINGLEDVQAQVNELVKQGDAKRAVRLYELFMAGCIEKMDDIHCEGEMGCFFENLLCSWLHARQKAKLDSCETVRQMLKMMDHDDYGLCYGVEKEVVNVLGRTEFAIFKEEICSRLNRALLKVNSGGKTINDFPWDVRNNTEILKGILRTEKNVGEYLKLCEKIGITPKDCEAIADIYKEKKDWSRSLSFVEQGLALEKEKVWPNQSGFCLSQLRRELLGKLGNKEEALKAAWEDFIESPCEYGYEELMKYVPKEDKKDWHDKAIKKARNGDLSSFIRLCVVVEEWDALVERILQGTHSELEEVSYYTMEAAIEYFNKHHYVAAAKMHRALGMGILKEKKSKCYHYALNHFEKAKELYQKSNSENEWKLTIEDVRKDHYRKYSFIGDFEDLVKGISMQRPSFLLRAQDRWNKQMA